MGVLRLFFALSVVLGHISINYLVSPIYAVQGFYIISGFYMAMILNERYVTPAANITFFKKRFMRLLPTYWLIALLSLLVAFGYYSRHKSDIMFFDFNHIPSETSLSTYLYMITTNIIVWGQDLALFLGISPETGNIFFSTLSFEEEYPMCRYLLIPVAWSISTEFTFYLLAPFILRKKYKWVALLFVLSIVSNIVTNYYGLNNSNWRFRFFPSVLLFFLTGYIAYLLYKRIESIHPSTRYKFYILAATILTTTVLLHINITFAIHECILLLIGLTSIPYLFYAFKSDKKDRIIGEMSYPLYLIHPFWMGINYLSGINNRLFVIVFSLLSAYCCYKYFITPIERFRSKIH